MLHHGPWCLRKNLSRRRNCSTALPSPTPDRTTITQSNPFCALPTEILQHIARESLPLEFEPALAFSCRHLKHILGTSSWLPLRRNPAESTAPSRKALENFLLLLSRDLEPGSGIVCFEHMIIHKRRSRSDRMLGILSRDRKRCDARVDFPFQLFGKSELLCQDTQLVIAGAKVPSVLTRYTRLAADLGCCMQRSLPGAYHNSHCSILMRAPFRCDCASYGRVICGQLVIATRLRALLRTDDLAPGSGEGRHERYLDIRFDGGKCKLTIHGLSRAVLKRSRRKGSVTLRAEQLSGRGSLQAKDEGDQTLLSLDLFMMPIDGYYGRSVPRNESEAWSFLAFVADLLCCRWQLELIEKGELSVRWSERTFMIMRSRLRRSGLGMRVRGPQGRFGRS